MDGGASHLIPTPDHWRNMREICEETLKKARSINIHFTEDESHEKRVLKNVQATLKKAKTFQMKKNDWRKKVDVVEGPQESNKKRINRVSSKMQLKPIPVVNHIFMPMPEAIFNECKSSPSILQFPRISPLSVESKSTLSSKSSSNLNSMQRTFNDTLKNVKNFRKKLSKRILDKRNMQMSILSPLTKSNFAPASNNLYNKSPVGLKRTKSCLKRPTLSSALYSTRVLPQSGSITSGITSNRGQYSRLGSWSGHKKTRKVRFADSLQN